MFDVQMTNAPSFYKLKATDVLQEHKTIVAFELPAAARVKLKIFFAEQEVRLLLNEPMPAGKYEIEFHHHGLPQGIYNAKLFSSTDSLIDIETTFITIK